MVTQSNSELSAEPPSVGNADRTCRLCSGSVKEEFKLTVLKKYEVLYFRCEACGSLQTEAPYWLEEAYTSSLSSLDTGAATRTIRNLAASYSVAKVYRATNVLDVGGGDGLLCRFLRDHGLNSYVNDKYSFPLYAQQFTEPNFSDVQLLTAFEVLEHFSDPASDLLSIFESRPRIVLLSTVLYDGQNEDWWYLAPDAGQHVFFYTKAALIRVADDQGYNLHFSGEFSLFLRKDVDQKFRTALVKILLWRRVNKLVSGIIFLLPSRVSSQTETSPRSID